MSEQPYWMSVAAAIAGEIGTDERIQEIMDEEYQRLKDPERGGADDAEMSKAVTDRLIGEALNTFPILRQIRDWDIERTRDELGEGGEVEG